MILQHIIFLPGRPPNTLFCTTVRIVSPGVLIIAPNTPAQNPNKEEMKKKQEECAYFIDYYCIHEGKYFLLL